MAGHLAAEFADRPGAERDALWTADATSGPAMQRFTLDERAREAPRRYGSNHLVSRCTRSIALDPSAAIARTAQRIDQCARATGGRRFVRHEAAVRAPGSAIAMVPRCDLLVHARSGARPEDRARDD